MKHNRLDDLHEHLIGIDHTAFVNVREEIGYDKIGQVEHEPNLLGKEDT